MTAKMWSKRIGALFGASLAISAMAGENVEVYGRADLSLDNKKIGVGRQLAVTSNASRLGFRGGEDLGNGLRAVYGLELGVEMDAVDAKLSTRNGFVGLDSKNYGSVAMGRLDSQNVTGSPLYSLVTKNTAFVVHDAGATVIGSNILNARNRTSNSVGYKSPVVAGFTFMSRYYLNGNELPVSPTGPIKSESDVKQLDLGLNYSAGPLGLGIGYGQDRKTGGLLANDFDNKWIMVGTYDFGLFKPYVIYGDDKYKNTATSRRDVKFWLAGTTVPVSEKGKVVANYMQRDVQSDRNGLIKKFQTSYQHQMSKRSMLFVFYDRENPNTNKTGNIVAAFGVGMQHNF